MFKALQIMAWNFGLEFFPSSMTFSNILWSSCSKRPLKIYQLTIVKSINTEDSQFKAMLLIDRSSLFISDVAT